jgi:hypothetical protein
MRAASVLSLRRGVMADEISEPERKTVLMLSQSVIHFLRVFPRSPSDFRFHERNHAMRLLDSTATLVAAGILAAAGLVNANDNAPSAPNAQQNQPAQQQTNAGQGAQNANGQSQQCPEGFVIVDERLITLTANEPQNHFLRAHEYLAQNDPRAAAAEVRIAAGYLDMQASRKGNADQQELRSESHQLRQLADQIWQHRNQAQQQHGGNAASNQNQKNNPNAGQSVDQKQLGEAFAKADRTLAKHFQEEAKNELKSHKAIRAGEDLDAATSALAASITWSGGQRSNDCTQAMADARRVSQELLMPGGEGQNATANNQPGEKNKAELSTNNKTNSETNNEAQPASARISGQGEQETPQTNARIPADAEKAVDELGKAIDSVGSNSTGQPNQNQSGQQRGTGSSSK